jgi:hypothetical protein
MIFIDAKATGSFLVVIILSLIIDSCACALLIKDNRKKKTN